MPEQFDVAAVRARVEAATKGPWHWEFTVSWDGLLAEALANEHGANPIYAYDGAIQIWSEGDKDFITQAPTDLAAACDEIERLRDALSKVRRVGHDLDCIFCGWKDREVDQVLGARTDALPSSGREA